MAVAACILLLSRAAILASISGACAAPVWCVAKASADGPALQQALDWACGHTDCSDIESGGCCYNPASLVSRASYAFNKYYQMYGRNSWNCDFSGTAVVVVSDPTGDWLQAPYVYYLHSHYGYSKGDIGRLFIVGFGSSMLFGTIVGSLSNKQASGYNFWSSCKHSCSSRVIRSWSCFTFNAAACVLAVGMSIIYT